MSALLKSKIRIKTPEQIAGIRVACRLASELLDYITPHVVAGASTEEIDTRCHRYIEDVQGAVPAPYHYCPPGMSPYPKATCISVNHVVCHGIPGARRLKKGDIVNIDVTVIKDGYYGDTSRMFLVGKPSVLAQRLCDTTWQTMWRGIEAVRPGARFGDIAAACQAEAEAAGFSVVREYGGHGVGVGFHEEPFVAHWGRAGTGEEILPGMVFTIEPMVNAGKRHLRDLSDGWTVVTADHSLSAQYEHEILVTETGYEVLTISDGAPKPPSWVKGFRF